MFNTFKKNYIINTAYYLQKMMDFASTNYYELAWYA
jgi:hypothetical protein